jgi:proline iminopeptidase
MTRWRRLAPALLAVRLFFAAGTANAQDNSFLSDGVRLHYRTSGSGAPLVFLSGGPGFDVDYMSALADLFPSGYARILFDQRGTGMSRAGEETSARMTLGVAVGDLEALRAHLKQERLFLVGHSWGGMLAMAYAAAHPDRIDRMVLIGSGGPTLEFGTWFGDNISARLRPEDVEARSYWQSAAKVGVDPAKASTGEIRAILPAYFFDRAKALAFATEVKDGSYHPDVNTLLYQDMEKAYDLRPGLRKLDRPVLIIQGHQDPIGDKTAEDIHALIRKSTLSYVDKAGHFPWIERPDEFRRTIAGFFNGGSDAAKR